MWRGLLCDAGPPHRPLGEKLLREPASALHNLCGAWPCETGVAHGGMAIMPLLRGRCGLSPPSSPAGLSGLLDHLSVTRGTTAGPARCRPEAERGEKGREERTGLDAPAA